MQKELWGNYSILFDDEHVKVKELVIQPGKKISFQKHKLRSELWFIRKGTATINYNHESTHIIRTANETFHVESGHWHQLINNESKPLHVIEIQYGSKTVEEDIERR